MTAHTHRRVDGQRADRAWLDEAADWPLDDLERELRQAIAEVQAARAALLGRSQHRRAARHNHRDA